MEHTMRPGDLVRVRTAGEILATLDEDGAVDGIPFMPEMLPFVDRRFRVSNKVVKICWVTEESSSRRLTDTVLLEDLRCDGGGHGGCQAECRLYWKEPWLERVDASTPERTSDEGSLARLRAVAEAGTRTTRTLDGEPESVYRCQITEAVRASTPLHPREWGQYIEEVRNGNIGLFTFLKVGFRMLYVRYAHRLGRSPGMPPLAGKDRADGPKLGLQAGELVEVRTLPEIGTTLDDRGRHRGLAYSEEMTPACGKRFRVKKRVDRIIDEYTGRMIELKNDCIVLEGLVCRGEHSPSQLFCPRQAYPFFREDWLKRVETPAAGHDPQPANGLSDAVAAEPRQSATA
jgi:hypothetical protein